MGRLQISTAWLVLGFLAPLSARSERALLEAPLPVDWRGTPLRNVLEELSQKLGLPYLVDPSVPAGALDQRLRLFASHLTHRQAFRWAARLGGVEAVIRDDIALLASREKLPRAWRLRGAGDPLIEVQRLAGLADRRANLSWLDTPLSAVARGVSEHFGLDVVFHPQIVAEEGLIRMQQEGADLAAVRAALEEQLRARTAIVDGALWVTPAGVDPEIAGTRPAAAGVHSRTQNPRAPSGPLEQFVVIDQTVNDWGSFCERIGRAAGAACRVSPEGVVWPTGFQGRGAVGDILESARLLGILNWRFVAGSSAGETRIELRPDSGGR